jgi:uncharacterized protein (UPF0371 family)
MTKLQIKEYNCQTQEEIIRDASNAEIEQMAKDKAEADAKKAEADAKAEAKTALLNKLGITADEAKLLLA